MQHRVYEFIVSTQVAPVFSPLPTSDMPPTFFRTGELQQQFQNIIDAYGVARYREANPAVFSMVTFPFLFAIMFGDLGHGIIMLLFAIYMVANERAMGKQDLGDILGMMFGGACCRQVLSKFRHMGFCIKPVRLQAATSSCSWRSSAFTRARCTTSSSPW